MSYLPIKPFLLLGFCLHTTTVNILLYTSGSITLAVIQVHNKHDTSRIDINLHQPFFPSMLQNTPVSSFLAVCFTFHMGLALFKLSGPENQHQELSLVFSYANIFQKEFIPLH